MSVFARATLMAAALFATAPTSSPAQTDYPRRAIKFVVPVPPGNVLDSTPRIIGERLTQRWHQPVVVENRPGAASNLGAEAVWKAEPDGYTLLVTPPGPLVVSPYVYSKLGFDPATFTPVSTLLSFPFVLTIHPKVPVANLAAFIARAKANPGKITFASPGVSSTPHLMMERFAIAAGIRFTHVPYQGFAPAARDLLAGHIDAMFDNPGNAVEQVRSGNLKALAVSGATRHPALPDTPALAEILPGVVQTDWFAVVAPPKTPAEIAARLSQAIAEILKEPDVAKRFTAFHVTTIGGTPAETAALMKREAEQFRILITKAGIKVQ